MEVKCRNLLSKGAAFRQNLPAPDSSNLADFRRGFRITERDRVRNVQMKQHFDNPNSCNFFKKTPVGYMHKCTTVFMKKVCFSLKSYKIISKPTGMKSLPAEVIISVICAHSPLHSILLYVKLLYMYFACSIYVNVDYYMARRAGGATS